MITTREFILCGSCFCGKYNSATKDIIIFWKTLKELTETHGLDKKSSTRRNARPPHLTRAHAYRNELVQQCIAKGNVMKL